MISAIIKLRKSTPVSYNSSDSKKRERYKGTIVEAFSRNYNGKVPKFRKGIELYGQVYFLQVTAQTSMLTISASQCGMR